MKIINLGRGQGKSTRLLYASEFQNIPILCGTFENKMYLMSRAKQLGLEIPEPITSSELLNRRDKSKSINEWLIDEAHWVLQCLLNEINSGGKIVALTITSDELDIMKNQKRITKEEFRKVLYGEFQF